MLNEKDQSVNGSEYNILNNDYYTLMSAMHVSVSKHLLNEGFTVIWANDFFYKATGFSKQEYEEVFHNDVQAYFKHDMEEYLKIKDAVEREYLSGNTNYSCTCRMPKKDGSHIWIRIIGTFTDEKRDEIPVVYTVFTDVTDTVEQKALQEKLEERTRQLMDALQMAEHANQAKSEFLSRMSHDIRTPMNAILGMVSIAEITPDDPVQMAACLGKIKNSAKFLLTLLNDILDMSKIESGKMVLRKKQFDFGELIRNITTMFCDQAAVKDIDFRVSASGELADYYVGDELKLNQILINLLGNAIKFTQEGGKVEFSIRTGNKTKKSTELLFTVKDNGIGMNKSFIENLFRPFEQEGRQRGNSHGTGLGLAIAWNYSHMMNGTIEVESKMSEGSSFTVHVWLDTADGVISAVALKERFKGKHALIAEDDSEEGEYIISLFKNFGVDAEFTLSAESIPRLLKQAAENGTPYNILQMDWRMPGAGQQLVRQIRKEYDSRELAIGVAAYDWSTIKAETLSADTSYFLQKPLFSSTIYDFLISLTQDRPVSLDEKGIKENFQFHEEYVLLADDNDINLEIAATLLESRNLKVETARDGQEAVDLFGGREPGHFLAVLLDIQMPLMDGLESARQIRAMKKKDAKTVPIIAMSANAFEEDVEKSLLAGMNAHISKPIDMDILFDTLQKYL